MHINREEDSLNKLIKQETNKQQWLNFIVNGVNSFLKPIGDNKNTKGAKQGKNGTKMIYHIPGERIKSGLEFLNNVIQIRDFAIERKILTERDKLRESRLNIEKQKKALIWNLKKPFTNWFNAKKLAELETQAEQIGSMAVGLDRALRLIAEISPEVVKEIREEANKV